MKRWILLSFTTCCLAAAADFSGKWAGTLETRNNPIPRSDSHYVTLVQKGEMVTGTAGPKIEVMWPLKDAKVTGDRIRFTVEAPGGTLVMEYSLELKDSELSGVVELKNREGISWNLKLKREQ